MNTFPPEANECARAAHSELTYAFKLRPSNSSNFPLLHQSNPLEEAPVRAQSSRLSSNVPNVFLNARLPQNHIASLMDSPISCVVLLPTAVSQLFTHSVLRGDMFPIALLYYFDISNFKIKAAPPPHLYTHPFGIKLQVRLKKTPNILTF